MSTPRKGPPPERECALPSCRKKFVPVRSDQKFHEDTCRTKAWLARRQEQRPAAPSSPPAPAPLSPDNEPLVRREARGDAPEAVLVHRLQRTRSMRGLPAVERDPLLSILAKAESAKLALRDPQLRSQLPTLEYKIASVTVYSAEQLLQEDLDDFLGGLRHLGLDVTPLPDGRLVVVVVAAGEPEGLARAAG